MTIRFLITLAAVAALTGCSDAPKAEVKEVKKEEPKTLTPLTGRQAFQQMYVSARQWAADAQPIQVKSMHLAEVKAAPGKSGAWQCTFVSPSRQKSRSYTWSAVESQGNLHQGVFAGQEDSYMSNRQTPPFLIAAIRSDSDEAYETAIKKSADAAKSLEGLTVNFLLEQTPRFPDLAWRVYWGETVSASQNTVFVDASTGQVLSRIR